MHLIQILLPLADNKGRPLHRSLYAEIQKKLTEKFGGITTYSRAPAQGRWQKADQEVRDEIVVYEVMTEELEKKWWNNYRHELEGHFQQEEIVIRALPLEML